MLARDRLAVLMPCHNGGRLLRESVMSCASAGLPASDYDIIVVDNCSTDGSLDDLPEADGRGAPIRIFRNETNLGRVGNWNRAVGIAESEGFKFAAFLFVGDVWIDDGSLAALLAFMGETNAVFGLAPLRIISESGGYLSTNQRISIPGPMLGVNASLFLNKSLATGALPLGPLQANIYRLGDNRRLVFDADDASHADFAATIEFLSQRTDPVAIASRPFVAWRARADRAHMSFDPLESFSKDIALVENAGRRLGLEFDWNSTHAGLFLRYAAVHWRRPGRLLPLLRRLRRDHRAFDLFKMARLAFAKIVRGRSMVWFSNDVMSPRWHVFRKQGEPRFAVDLNGRHPSTVVRLMASNSVVKKLAFAVAVIFLKAFSRSARTDDRFPLDDDFINRINQEVIKTGNVLPEANDPSISLYFGTRSTNRTNVLQLVYRGGLLANREKSYFAKIPAPGYSAEGVRNEAAVLRSLASDPVLAPHVPRVVAAGDFGSCYAMLMEGVGCGATETKWESAFEAVLNRLATNFRATSSWSVGPASRNIVGAADAIEGFGYPPQAALLKDLDHRLQREWGDVELPFVLCHGDFVPWNVRNVTGRHFILDWEWARTEVIGYDLFNFFVFPICRQRDGTGGIRKWAGGASFGAMLERVYGPGCRTESWFRPKLLFETYLAAALAFHGRNFYQLQRQDRSNASENPSGVAPVPVVLERYCRDLLDAAR